MDEKNKKPLSERLIFKKPKNELKIKIKTNKKSYCPGDKVKLTVSTYDYKGKKVPSILGITVTDESVLESIEKRKQAPRLKSMVFLESEVEHLDDANIYFSRKDENSVNYIDLLLGVQGWRRFIYKNTEKFYNKNKELAEKLFCIHEGETKPYNYFEQCDYYNNNNNNNNNNDYSDDEDEGLIKKKSFKKN